jgi:glycosyltransferase involved in cell wall biosynthesis
MSEKVFPRVLVSTVGRWSDVGADAWSMLLSKYDISKVASLYLRAGKSKSPCCNRYFHIYEEQVMKSIFHPHIQTGEAYFYSVEDDHDTTDVSDLQEKEKERYAKYSKKRSWFNMFARELVWKIGHWKSREFKQFIDDFNPEVLVFPIESYIHLNRINKYIIKKKHPRVIGFFNDDNFSYKQSKDLGYKLHRFWLRHSVKWLVRHCDTVFAVCPKMKRECDKEFGINSIVLSKPMVCNTEFIPYQPNTPIRLMYAGKLYINRDKTIISIAKAIKKINENGVKIVMDVYSGSPLTKDTIEAIECSSASRFRGEIPYSQVFEEMSKSDVLLFVEDLSEENLAARLSFSTKITDLFGSGKCTWAIGNNDLGPIEYIKEQDAGFVSTYEDSIYDTLARMVEQPALISQYALKGYECGQNNHNVDNLVEVFEKAILNNL